MASHTHKGSLFDCFMLAASYEGHDKKPSPSGAGWTVTASRSADRVQRDRLMLQGNT